MSTCFIFINHPNHDAGLSLRISAEGHLEEELKTRSVEEIHALQANAETIVILPADAFSIHYVELPWLGEKKARLAIPFALEDKLAENISDLHFAFDKKYYQNGQYLVVVSSKSYLHTLIHYLNDNDLRFDRLTVDWFALENLEACVTSSHLLVHEKTFFSGSLPFNLALLGLKDLPSSTVIHTFSDSTPLIKPEHSVVESGMMSGEWIAQRLQKKDPFNLCQGEFQQKTAQAKNKQWWIAACALTLAWVITFITNHVLDLKRLNHQITDVDQQIARVYRQFFPEAKQIINPRARITQWLKSSNNNHENSLWLLLNQLSMASQNKDTTIDQIKFHDRMLQVILTSKDFQTLENIENFLQQKSIHVKRIQAASHEGRVLSTLELSL